MIAWELALWHVALCSMTICSLNNKQWETIWYCDLSTNHAYLNRWMWLQCRRFHTILYLRGEMKNKTDIFIGLEYEAQKCEATTCTAHCSYMHTLHKDATYAVGCYAMTTDDTVCWPSWHHDTSSNAIFVFYTFSYSESFFTLTQQQHTQLRCAYCGSKIASTIINIIIHSNMLM